MHMGQTLVEKLLAKSAGKRKVVPGEYVVLKNFTGPIGYSFRGFNFAQAVKKLIEAIGASEIKFPEHCILNGDHNIPHQSADDVRLFQSVRETARTLGIDSVYDREGIGHVVNIEKGRILPGSVFIHMDPQAANAGGIGALFTN
jgi:3-isopropylmalate/(R)-2-methylmalate dehydratase large subunit